jgi:hypothetical protein
MTGVLLLLSTPTPLWLEFRKPAPLELQLKPERGRQERPPQAPRALLGPRAPCRRRPRGDPRPVASTPPEPLRPSDGAHRVGTPGAGPRRVAQARDHAPFRHRRALRAATTGRHQGDSEDRRRAVAQRAAEIAERRAVFDEQQQLRRQGSTLASLHTQTRAGRWSSSGPGSCMGVE